MNSTTRARWQDADFELEQEFADEIGAWRIHREREAVPAVARSVERQIRSHARLARASAEGERHWVFGQAPQLALGALILFAVATVFALLPTSGELVRFRVDAVGMVTFPEDIDPQQRRLILEHLRRQNVAGRHGTYQIRLPAMEVTALEVEPR